MHILRAKMAVSVQVRIWYDYENLGKVMTWRTGLIPSERMSSIQENNEMQ